MIKKILCKFGTILTLFWAAALVLSSGIVNQINGLMTHDAVRFLFASGLIAIGFWLSQKCDDGSCSST